MLIGGNGTSKLANFNRKFIIAHHSLNVDYARIGCDAANDESDQH